MRTEEETKEMMKDKAMESHFQEYLIVSVIDDIKPFKTGSKRYFCCLKGCIRGIVSRKTGLCNPHHRRYLKGKCLLSPLKPYLEFNNCIILGCYKQNHAKGLCQKHYDCKKRNGDPLINKLPRGRRCMIKDCFNNHMGKSYCSKHYAKFKKYGDPLFKINEEAHKYVNCLIKNCNNKYHAKGYCIKHYYLNIQKIKNYIKLNKV